MSYHGDIRVGKTIYFHFTTRQFSTGAPITSASLAISVYKNDSTTESTSGVTTTFSGGFDGRAGLVSVKLDTSSDGTFYAAGNDFSLVVTGGTADSVSIVGEAVKSFSIENRSAIMSTTADRKLTVDASGRALADLDTIKTNPVANGGTFTFPTNATGASTANITAGTITTVTTLTNLPAITANWLTAAGISAGALNGKGDWMVTYTQPTGFLAANFTTGVPADVKKVNGTTVNGDGSATPWGP